MFISVVDRRHAAQCVEVIQCFLERQNCKCVSSSWAPLSYMLHFEIHKIFSVGGRSEMDSGLFGIILPREPPRYHHR